MQPEASGLPCGLNDQIHRCKESLISEFGRALENDKICEQEEEIELTFIKLTGSIVIEINRNGEIEHWQNTEYADLVNQDIESILNKLKQLVAENQHAEVLYLLR